MAQKTQASLCVTVTQ